MTINFADRSINAMLLILALAFVASASGIYFLTATAADSLATTAGLVILYLTCLACMIWFATLGLSRYLKRYPGRTVFVAVLALRVAIGTLFVLSLMGQGNREGEMLILLDIPAMAVFAILQLTTGWPCCIGGPLDFDYLFVATVGWTLTALALATVTVIASRRVAAR